jgi:hypothetical protein
MLVMSGFYKEDIPAIRAAAEGRGLTYGHFSEIDQWVLLHFVINKISTTFVPIFRRTDKFICFRLFRLGY